MKQSLRALAVAALLAVSAPVVNAAPALPEGDPEFSMFFYGDIPPPANIIETIKQSRTQCAKENKDPLAIFFICSAEKQRCNMVFFCKPRKGIEI